MQVVTCHIQADFDALAAVLAAGKLYPHAVLVLPGKVKDNVREFIVLYKDYLPVCMSLPNPPEPIDTLIVVDTGNRDRLGFLQPVAENPKVKIIVYDHHPKTDDSLPGYYENLGAVTTLLVEQLIAKGVGVNAFEATLMLLGIYEDTGFLTFAGTTARDVKAVAWLLEQGAGLWAIQPFLSQPLAPPQQELLAVLLNNCTLAEYHRVKVLLAQAAVPEYTGGLSLLAGEISKLHKADAVFLVVEMAKKVYVVGRSTSDMLPVNHILETLGGGGHPRAASATIKSATADEVLTQLKHVLSGKLRPPFLAKDLMSSPVRTVQMGQSVAEVGEILAVYGYSGCPVMDGDRVVGMVSRRDTDKAVRHGLGHGPVKGFMNPHVGTVVPEATLAEILTMIQEDRAGRLLVVRDEELKGIISRSDIVQIMHSGREMPLSGMQMWPKLQASLSVELMHTLNEAADLAISRREKIYLVGGAVRDLFLGPQAGQDLDLVIEGDSLSFAEELVPKIAGQIAPHAQFATATVNLPNGWHIDIASARQEYYVQPAALPVVRPGSIRQDLGRRDFTMNAMAVSLNPEDRGRLLDFFGGRMDITARQLRVLHPMSFTEDPTRLLRGIRFACRYGFTWEKETAALVKEAIASLAPGKLTPFRVWDEIRLLFLEENPWPAVEQMVKNGLWQLILPDIPFTPALETAFAEAPSFLTAWLSVYPRFDRVLFYVMIILNGLDQRSREKIATECQLPRYYRRQLQKVREAEGKLFRQGRGKNTAPGDLHDLLQDIGPEGLLYLMLFGNPDLRSLLSLYSRRRLAVGARINGSDLQKLGFQPGPAFREALSAIARKKIDGWSGGKDEELALAKKMLMELEKKDE